MNKNICDCESIQFWGTSVPVCLSKGWIYAIKHDEKFGHWSIIINHTGEQEEIHIAYCPICGRELK